MVKKIKSFLFENQTLRQTVAKNTFWLGLSNIGGRLIRAIIIIYAARILGAKDWGIFSYALSFAALISIFVEFGTGAVVTRETAKIQDEKERSKIVSTTFFLKSILISLGVFAVIFLGPKFSNIKEAEIIFPIAALIIVFDSLREFGFAIMRALEKMEWEAGLYILTNASIVILGLLVLYFVPGVKIFTYAYAAGNAIGMIATFFTLRKYLKNLFQKIDFGLLKSILYSSWPIAISGVLGSLMINTDIILIGFFKSAESVGFYSAAQRPIQLLYLFPSIIATSIFPALARLANKENLKIRQILERTISISLLAALPISIGGAILGRDLINLVFGAGYEPAVLSFQILLLTILVNFPALILINAIFAYNRQKSLVALSAIGGVSNVILDLIFIPPFGITGSAAATLLSQALTNFYLWRKLKKINYFEILPHMKKIFAATAIMTGGTLIGAYFGLNVISNIILSAIIYFYFLSLLKEPLLQEVRLILRLEKQDKSKSAAI